MSVKPLHNMESGDIAQIIEFVDNFRLKSRFMEMGIIPTREVRMIKKTPFNGPIEIKIRSFYLTIRYEDASWILVS